MVNGSRRRTPTRRPRASGGGGNKWLGRSLWALFILALIFAFYQIPAKPTIPGFWNTLVAKSEVVKNWAVTLGGALENGDPIDLGGGGGRSEPYDPNNPSIPSPNTSDTSSSGSGTEPNPSVDPAPETNVTALDKVEIKPAEKSDYSRDDWKHWVNVRECWTVREQVLAEEATSGSLKMLDSRNKPTSDINSACSIQAGQWVDLYSGKTFTNPGELDIDHMIPLSYAAQHGAASWDNNRKSGYANDLSFSGHLVAVSASENRSKGDKGPSDWKPSNKASWCVYANDWVTVANNWQLSITESDKKALQDMLKTCSP